MRSDLPQGGNLLRTRMGRQRHHQSLRGKTGSAIYLLGELLSLISVYVHTLHALTVDRGEDKQNRDRLQCVPHMFGEIFL